MPDNSHIIGVYRALYAYTAASPQELSVGENDLLYLLEKADDGWWTVKRRVPGAAAEEPIGIVPHNYIAPADPIKQAKSLYAYQAQTDEELTFQENAPFDVYAEDGDWVLVGCGDSYGFVPANYIEILGGSTPRAPPKEEPTPAAPAVHPAALSVAPSEAQPAAPIVSSTTVQGRVDSGYEEEEDAPPKPPRPNTTGGDLLRSRDRGRDAEGGRSRSRSRSPERSRRGEPLFRTWQVQEVEGRIKAKATLSISSLNILLSSDRLPQRQWDSEDLLTYNSEKKHVFLDLQNPRTSLDLKAKSQDDADQIIMTLGQLAGANRAGGGLNEVYVAAKSAGQRQAVVGSDFQASKPRELSVREGSTVTIIDSKDRHWWKIRNAEGREGFIPRKCLESEEHESKLTSFARGLGLHGRERKEREKREKAREARERQEREYRREERNDRERYRERERDRERERERDQDRYRSRDEDRRRDDHQRDNDRYSSRSVRRSKSTSGSKRDAPNPKYTRRWTDRTGTFHVEAELLGLADGKVHLHKINGVKIAVPANRLSEEDLDYIENVTGVSMRDDRPLAEISRSKSSATKAEAKYGAQAKPEPPSEISKDGFDWFQFFLDCGVEPQFCKNYAVNFTRDNMEESILPEITSDVLRTLGLREGDILRVTKKINEKYRKTPLGGELSKADDVSKNTGSNSMPAPAPAPAPAPVPAPAPAPSAAPAPAAVPPQQPIDTALQPQKTAEAQLQALQRANQQRLLREQAELQKEQIKVLKQQQEQIKKQQEQLLEIQKTGLQALGPFATGVAQLSTGVGMMSAAMPSTLLAAQPQPPAPRMTTPVHPFQMVAQQVTGGQQRSLINPVASQPSGAPTLGQLTGQRAGPSASVPPTTFGQTTQPTLTGQHTGPFGLPQSMPARSQSSNMNNMPTTTFGQQLVEPVQPVLTGQRTGPFNSFTTAGTQAQLNASLTGQRATTFGQQFTGNYASQPPATTFGQQSLNGALTGQRTGPYSASSGLSGFQPTSDFGKQLVGQQAGTFSSLQQTQSQPLLVPSMSAASMNSDAPVGALSMLNLGQPHPSGAQQFSHTGPFVGTQPGFGVSAILPSQPFIQSPMGAAMSQSMGQPIGQPMGPVMGQMMNPLLSQPIGQPMPMGQAMGPMMGQSMGQPMDPYAQGQAYGQALPYTPQVLQSQPTGFGFGNQPTEQRANISMASSSNPFGLG